MKRTEDCICDFCFYCRTSLRITIVVRMYVCNEKQGKTQSGDLASVVKEKRKENGIPTKVQTDLVYRHHTCRQHTAANQTKQPPLLGQPSSQATSRTVKPDSRNLFSIAFWIILCSQLVCVGHVLQVIQGHDDAAGASTHKRTSGAACEMNQSRGGCLLKGGGGKGKQGWSKKMRKKCVPQEGAQK